MTSVLWSTRGTLAKGSLTTLAVSTPRFKFASFCDSFEFPVWSCSFALWTFLTWRNMFLFAPKLFSQWVHLTFSWFFRCVTSKLLFMNDFGLFCNFQPCTSTYPLWVYGFFSCGQQNILCYLWKTDTLHRKIYCPSLCDHGNAHAELTLTLFAKTYCRFRKATVFLMICLREPFVCDASMRQQLD